MGTNDGGAALRRWRRAAGGVAVVGVVLVAGCAREHEGGLGGGDLPEVPAAPDDAEAMLLDAVERTRAAESVDLTSTIDVGFSGFELDDDWTADGVGEIRGSLRGFGGAVTFEIRSDGTTAWIRTDDPDVRQLLLPGVSWIEGPRDEILTDGALSEIDGLWAFLLFLRGVDSIDAGGIESVEGTDVRMVSGTIDREAAYDGATAAERELMDNAYSSSSTSTDESFAFELGIDGDRRIRRLDSTITPSDDEGFGSPAQLHLEVRRFDHEVETPAPPPAGETVSVDDIPGGLDVLTDDD